MSTQARIPFTAGIARELLDADPGDLDATSRKVRQRCMSELEIAAVSGCIDPSGCLRASLILAATLIKLDIQELESINSMVKICVARSGNNSISLELLSSRIGIRKTIMSLSGNCSKFAVLTQCAASLARACFLHFEKHKAIESVSTRWRTPSEIVISTPDVSKFNPALLPNRKQRWAHKYAKSFTKVARKHLSTSNAQHVLVMVLPTSPTSTDSNNPGVQKWALCEITRSHAMMCKLEQVCRANKPITCSEVELYGFSHPVVLSMAIDVVASLYDLALSTKTKVRRADDDDQGFDRLSILHRMNISTQCFKVSSTHHLESGMADAQVQVLEPIEQPQYLMAIKAPYQRTGPNVSRKGKITNDDDDDSDDDKHNVDVDLKSDSEDEDQLLSHAVAARKHRDEFTKILSGWDQYSDNSSDCEETNQHDELQDLDEATTLNINIAATVANKQMEWSTKYLNTVDARVDERLQSQGAGDLTSTAVDQEQDAVLQEVFTTDGQPFVPDDDNERCDHVHKEQTDVATLTETMLSDAFDVWQDEIIKSCWAITLRSKGQSSTVGKNRELSLVGLVDKTSKPETATVHFVQWVSYVDSKQGRSIRLDERHRVICPVNYIHQPISFKDGTVLWNALGVRVRKDVRPEMPALAVRLHRMFESAISLHVGRQEHILFFDQGAMECCDICGLDGGSLCAWCLKNTHPRCCSSLKDYIVSSAERSDIRTYKGSAGISDVFQSVRKDMFPRALLGVDENDTIESFLGS